MSMSRPTTQLLRQEVQAMIKSKLGAGKIQLASAQDYKQITEELVKTKQVHENPALKVESNKKFQGQLLKQLRFILLELVQESITAKKSLDELNIGGFFDFLQQLVDGGLLAKFDLFVIFEDLFESSPESVLEDLFQIMETQIRQRHLLDEKDPKEQQHLQTIFSKICKMVMKKLSITHDTRFRGRVQTLIAAAFPLTHPSGLNKSGQFNTKNTTSYESLEELKEDISKSKGVAQISDYKLYKNFWNLQNYLSNPFIIFSNVKIEFEDVWENPDQEMQDADSYHNNEKLDIDQDESGLEEEEGQAEPEISASGEIGSFSPSKKLQGTDSNLVQILTTIKDFVNRFLSQPLQIDKENAQILSKYPKYLSKYSLLTLQFQDFLFRETFLVQVLIFLQSIQTPLNQSQKKLFTTTDDEKKLLQWIEAKVQHLLQDINHESSFKIASNNKQQVISKRQSMGECVTAILEHEVYWSKWKENKCFNFEKPLAENIKQKKIAYKKRDQKFTEKLLVTPNIFQGINMNQIKNGQNCLKTLRGPNESLEASKIVKLGELPPISDSLLPILMDLDPAQGVEDAYKKKHDQLFCWRFLRAISQVELSNFFGWPALAAKFKQFEADVEEQARILHSKSEKRPIVIVEAKDEAEEEEAAQENGNGTTAAAEDKEKSQDAPPPKAEIKA